jgi:hypothetical protein
VRPSGGAGEQRAPPPQPAGAHVREQVPLGIAALVEPLRSERGGEAAPLQPRVQVAAADRPRREPRRREPHPQRPPAPPAHGGDLQPLIGRRGRPQRVDVGVAGQPQPAVRELDGTQVRGERELAVAPPEPLSAAHRIVAVVAPAPAPRRPHARALDLEADTAAAALLGELQARAHPCARVVELRSGLAAIAVDRHGRLTGAADPRRDGAAYGAG